jgi:hypothetical protein
LLSRCTLLVISTKMQYEMQMRPVDQGSMIGQLMPSMNTDVYQEFVAERHEPNYEQIIGTF